MVTRPETRPITRAEWDDQAWRYEFRLADAQRRYENARADLEHWLLVGEGEGWKR